QMVPRMGRWRISWESESFKSCWAVQVRRANSSRCLCLDQEPAEHQFGMTFDQIMLEQWGRVPSSKEQVLRGEYATWGYSSDFILPSPFLTLLAAQVSHSGSGSNCSSDASAERSQRSSCRPSNTVRCDRPRCRRYPRSAGCKSSRLGLLRRAPP